MGKELPFQCNELIFFFFNVFRVSTMYGCCVLLGDDVLLHLRDLLRLLLRLLLHFPHRQFWMVARLYPREGVLLHCRLERTRPRY